MKKLIIYLLGFFTAFTLSAQGGNFQMPKSEQDVMNLMQQFMGSNGIKFEEQDLGVVVPSKFVGSFNMEFTTSSGGKSLKEESGKMRMNIDQFKVAIIPEFTEEGQSRIILDRQTGQMTMLTTDKKGKKTGIRMKMPKIVVESEVVESKSSEPKITITNEKKMIEGYSCTKVIIEDTDYRTEAWVSEDKNLSLFEIFSFIDISNQQKSGSKQDIYAGLTGLAMESTTVSKKRDETTVVKITNLNKGNLDSGVFSTDGYQVVDMANMMDFGR